MQPSTPPPLPPRTFTFCRAQYEHASGSINDSTIEESRNGTFFMVPFQRPGRLVGRQTYIANIDGLLTTGMGHKRIALYGLGGIG